MATVEKDQYDQHAALYDAIEELPQSPLYQEMVLSAIDDWTDKNVLDLGGGTGLHARNVVDEGAKRVDVVDISGEMLEIGKRYKSRLGREDQIRWFIGDLTGTLTEAPLDKEGYDVVMVNWTFDHAETVDDLERMWQNTAAYTKKGGKLISIRMANPKCAAGKVGTYGISFSNIEEIAGGLKYMVTARVDPPLTFPATTLSETMMFEKSKLMARRYGFTDFKKVVEEEMETVKKDPEFWKVHVDDPAFVCVTATKVDE